MEQVRQYGEQPASMEAWEAMTGEEQAEIASRAAKRATQQARAYGLKITADEIWGDTWAGIVDRLAPDYLDRHNARREQPLTMQHIAFRAAHAAAEACRYDQNKHGSDVSLEDWDGVDSHDVERSVINRLAVSDYVVQLDERGQTIAKLIMEGHTERQAGKAVGISGPGVHKRITQMRRELQEAIA